MRLVARPENAEGLFTDWLAGWKRLCPPQAFRGQKLRTAGQQRLERALGCVDDRGRRRAPWPRWPARQWLATPDAAEDAAEQARLRRELGVV